MVRTAADEVTDVRPRKALQWHHGWTAAALTAILAVSAFALVPRMAQAPAVPSSPSEPALARPAPTPVAPERSERLDALLRDTPRDQSFGAAIARIETLWEGAGSDRTTLRTHLTQVQRLDLPVILEMFHPSRRDTCFLALLSLEGQTARVAVGDEELREVPWSQVDELWTREAVFPWPESRAVPAGPRGTADWLRAELQRLGYANEDPRVAVQRFQQDAGLVPDGVPGPRTRLFLYALSPGQRPRLSADGGDS
jgi:hypothetical protein